VAAQPKVRRPRGWHTWTPSEKWEDDPVIDAGGLHALGDALGLTITHGPAHRHTAQHTAHSTFTRASAHAVDACLWLLLCVSVGLSVLLQK
jgi:hypothetical protein